jgi:CHAT domain-containing protein
MCALTLVKKSYSQENKDDIMYFLNLYKARNYTEASIIGSNILSTELNRPKTDDRYRILYQTILSYWYSNNLDGAYKWTKKTIETEKDPLFKSYIQLYNAIVATGINDIEHAKNQFNKLLIENNQVFLQDSVKAKIFHNLAVIYSREEKNILHLKFLRKSFDLEQKSLINSTNYESYNLSVEALGSALYREYKQFEEAYQVYQEALSHPFNKEISELNHSLYQIYIDLLFKMGKETKAQHYADQLIHFYKSNDQIYQLDLARLFLFLCFNYDAQNNYTKTIYYATKVLSNTSVSNNSQDIRSSANATLTYTYFQLQQLDKMKYYIFKDIEECKQTNQKLLADAYLFAGRYLAKTFEDDLAYNYIDSAKHLYYNTLNLPLDRNIENNIARVYLELEQYNQSLHHLNNISQILKNNQNYTNYYTWYNNYAIARCYTHLKKVQEAQDLLIETNADMRKQYPHLIDKSSSIQGSQIGGLYRNVNINLVKNLYKQYEKTNDAKLLSQAISYIYEADNALENLRDKQSYDRDRLITGEMYHEFTQQSTKVTMALYETTKNEKYLHEAFEFVQKGKSYALLQGVTEKRYKLNSGIPIEVINALNHHKKQYDLFEVRYNNALLSHKTDSSLLSGLSEKMSFCMAKIDSLNFVIKDNYPEYQSEKQKMPYISMPEIQSRLGQNQIIIDYYQTDKELFRFTISKTDYRCDIIPLDQFFSSNLKLVINQLSTPFIGQHSREHIRAFTNASYKLYKTLLKDIEQLTYGKELIIVPHSELNYLPFETLLTKDVSSSKPKFREFPWLIKRQIISYSYNTAMFTEYSSSPTSFNKLLAFAPHYTGSTSIDSINLNTELFLDTILVPLSGAQKEIQAIEKSFTTQTFAGKQAIKSSFIATLQNNDILHLAMHSLNDEIQPFNSQIVFASEDSISGSFKAAEIYNYDIKSPLIVLSSCSTGRGQKKNGEGLLSIARAFTYAGAEAQVMTLWPVNDVSGAEITELFYKELKTGLSKNKALQKSKLNYLAAADGIKSHPYYWANYVLAGNTQAIKQKMPKGIFVYLLAFALLSVILLFIFDRKQSS